MTIPSQVASIAATARTLTLLAALSVPLLLAQSQEPSTEELQRQTQNPVADLISVPFQNNTNFPVGRAARVQDILNIQPVIPARLTEQWNLITRVIAPIVYQPVPNAGEGGANGLGDLNPTFFLSPPRPGRSSGARGRHSSSPAPRRGRLGRGNGRPDPPSSS